MGVSIAWVQFEKGFESGTSVLGLAALCVELGLSQLGIGVFGVGLQDLGQMVEGLIKLVPVDMQQGELIARVYETGVQLDRPLEMMLGRAHG